MRASRLPRVRALFRAIWKIQVRRAERPSKRSIPSITAIQVSPTTSSATERLETCADARRRSAGVELLDEGLERAGVAGAKRFDYLGVRRIRQQRRCGPCVTG